MQIKTTDIHSILNDVFGYQSFRGEQENIIKHVIAKNNSVVIMPTGAGKSLCFQIPAIVMDGLTIVISPLIALMKDQVEALVANGVEAGAINSSNDPDEAQRIIQKIDRGELKLLYLSPERAVTDRFLSYIKGKNVSMIAIDEAHCVSVWGNDFRPEYTQLTKLTSLFPDSPVMALTATADYATQLDIQKQLQIAGANVSVSSFERHNITIEVRPAINRIDHIKRYIMNRSGQAGIVYCLSRKSTESLAKKLRDIGIKAQPYHGRLDRKVKDKVQNDFQSDDVQVVCATIAFGMGIDKSNIRFVMHYNLPKNVEAYYQEIGRAGRDGKPADAVLFAGFNDVATFRSMIDDGDAHPDFKRVQTQKLDRIWEFSQASNCRTNFILNYFGEIKTDPCNHCDNCKNPPETIDGLKLAQMALSAVVRCRQEVGIQLLADILRGSFRAEVRIGGFEKIKTFGAGRDVPRVHWLQYIVQLANHGALAIDYTRNAKLSITEYGMSLLKGEKEIRLAEPRDYTKNAKNQVRVKKVTKAELFQNGLFEHMKLWRSNEARRDRVSPVNIFSDKALDAISIEVPMFYNQLQEIDGFSKVKLKRYAQPVLHAIHLYIIQQKHRKSIKGKSVLDTYLLYKKGMKAKDMAKKRDVSVQTIYKHIADLLTFGEPIHVLDFVSESQIKKVSDVLEKQGVLRAENIAEHITEVIGLGEIQLILAHLEYLKEDK